ncbi:MAG TPA: triose-phosphate isomerase [Candidatus Paceibacterota bacterium]|nr:triose-phosphate isomerase [Candidatus Paceibacterota bacterium]
MKKFIIANWKMMPRDAAHVREILVRTDEFLQGFQERTPMSLVFCPPFVFLDEVAGFLRQSHLLHDAELGAQDVAARDEGAATGEVSGSQLVASGVRYVIVGHSERRAMGEDDDAVNAKLKAALRNGLVPIVCVGEVSRDGEWEDMLRAQLRGTFRDSGSDDVSRCLIAYEPVWAISTTPGAKPDTPASAAQSAGLIREFLRSEFGSGDVRVLYGGSVKPDNAAGFLTDEAFNGVLVGGASVKPDDFAAIIRASVIT